jgi:hypothetical protein
LAEEAGVDLVEIAPMAVPPVCRIMDFGKFKYQEQKRQHEQKLKQKQVQVKEVKLRPGTDENDYQIKLRNMTRFLQEEDKARSPCASAVAKWRTRKSACARSSGSRPICRNWPGRADAQDGRAPDGDDLAPKQEKVAFVEIAPQGAVPTGSGSGKTSGSRQNAPGDTCAMFKTGAFNAQDEDQERRQKALQGQLQWPHQASARRSSATS